MTEESKPEWLSQEKLRRYVKLIPLFFWLGMIFYVFAITRAAGGVIPLCLFHFLTGYDCPGCGMTRASTFFIKGEFMRSLSYHPGGILFVTWLTVVTMYQTTEFILDRELALPATVDFAYRCFVKYALYTLFLYGVVRLALELVGCTRPL